MKIITYDIVYCSNYVFTNISCTNLNLAKYIEKIQNDGGEIAYIFLKDPQCINQKSKDTYAKDKYYKNKYSSTFRKLKSKKINKNEFDNTINVLKKLKKECETKEEFELNFEEYLKNH